jgi:molybdate transport system substrate-binding protein
MKQYRHTISLARDVGGDAAGIKVWGPRAIATVLWEVGSQFELLSGHELDIDSALVDSFVDRMNAGERFDVFIGLPAFVDTLIASGKILAESRTPLVRCGMGVEVRAGAPRPDISSVEAFKQALLNARSIGFLNVGGGVHIDKIIARLGLADALSAKIVRPNTDIVSELVARDDIELGMVITGQILTTNGVQFVGPLPPELQYYVTFVGGVSSDAKARGASQQLLGFLREEAAATVISAQGMEPAGNDSHGYVGGL